MNWKRASRHAANTLRRTKRYAPEERANRTKGIMLIGKITLRQYELLVGRGYDGDVVRKWTKYRASQEIRKILSDQ